MRGAGMAGANHAGTVAGVAGGSGQAEQKRAHRYGRCEGSGAGAMCTMRVVATRGGVATGNPCAQMAGGAACKAWQKPSQPHRIPFRPKLQQAKEERSARQQKGQRAGYSCARRTSIKTRSGGGRLYLHPPPPVSKACCLPATMQVLRQGEGRGQVGVGRKGMGTGGEGGKAWGGGRGMLLMLLPGRWGWGQAAAVAAVVRGGMGEGGRNPKHNTCTTTTSQNCPKSLSHLSQRNVLSIQQTVLSPTELNNVLNGTHQPNQLSQYKRQNCPKIGANAETNVYNNTTNTM